MRFRDNRYRTVQGALEAALLGVVTVLAVGSGCSGDGATLAPLGRPAGSVIAGTVRAMEAPLSGATIRLELIAEGRSATVLAALAAETPVVRATTTDEAGRFSFSDLEPGDYLLTASGRNHLVGTRRAVIAASGLEPLAPETTFVDVALMPTGTMTGTAVLATEASHRGTIVYVDGTSIVAITEDSGRFSLRDVPVGSHTIRALHAGYRESALVGTLGHAGDSTDVGLLVLGIDGNIAPTVVAAPVNPVDLNASATFGGTASDVDGSIVRYQWDFEDDGEFDWSSSSTATTSHLYPGPGEYRARLRVTDDDGAVGYAVTSVLAYDYVHVTPSGSDAGTGLREAPLATLYRAYEVAQSVSEALAIRIAQGTYTEPIVFRDVTPVSGGFDPTLWTREEGDRSVFLVGSTAALASNLDEVVILGLDIRATATDTLGNSVALHVVDCNDDVRFVDCRFQSSNAVHGINGMPGTAGIRIDGLDGQSPVVTVFGGAGGGTAPFTQPGTGGDGGGSSTAASAGIAGTHGAAGGLAGGSGGGNGGNGGTPPANSAAQGLHGAAAPWWGDVVAGTWRGATGGDGTAGETSIGGGGGGGGLMLTPNDIKLGGGGGGQGGTSTGGAGGARGGAAGSSFAVFCDLSVGLTPVFEGCTFVSGSGGNGGNGGSGGNPALPAFGGNGAPGATLPPHSGGTGGNGGNSSVSGGGGGGAGAPGGLSYCLFFNGFSEPTIVGGSFTFGSPGAGGIGGQRGGSASQAPNGLPGSAGSIFDNVQ